MQQTNNRIYNKKQRYMLALKEIVILKTQTENEVLNDGLDKVYATEINNIYTRLIVGLLEEGLKYKYIKDADDPNRDIIQLIIDNVTYECRNIDVKEILGDRYDEIMDLKYDGPTIAEIQESKKNNIQPQAKDITDALEDIKQSILTGNKKKIEPPKIDYVPPKVTLQGKDTKLIRKEKAIDKIIKTLISLIITIIILTAGWIIYKSVPGLEDKVNQNLKDMKQEINNSINGVDLEETSSASTEQETINVNNISNGIAERDGKKNK